MFHLRVACNYICYSLKKKTIFLSPHISKNRLYIFFVKCVFLNKFVNKKLIFLCDCLLQTKKTKQFIMTCNYRSYLSKNKEQSNSIFFILFPLPFKIFCFFLDILIYFNFLLMMTLKCILVVQELKLFLHVFF